MRTSSLILLGMLATAGAVQAQSYPAPMVVTLPEVEVRSGPTMEYYPTGKLKYGDAVQVVGESEQAKGWLAIKPPKGSFSWINEKFVKQIYPDTGVVITEGGAQVLVGSAISAKVPNFNPPFKIPKGAIVTILGKGNAADGITWLPIQPWPQEVRFIPGNAVQSRQFASNNSANINGASAPQNSWTPAQTPGHPTQMAQASSWSVGQTASFSKPAPPSQNLVYPAQWSKVGVLRRAAFDKDGQPTYVLEDKGNILMYATCQPGTTLRDFVGRTVALYGSITYRSDDYLRTHFMTASLVAAY